MKKYFVILFALLAMLANAQTIKMSQFPNVNTLLGGDQFLIGRPNQANFNMTYAQLYNQIIGTYSLTNLPGSLAQLTTNGMVPAPTPGQLASWNGTAWVAVSAGAGTGNALTNNTAVQTFSGPNAFANPLNVYTGLGFLAANSVSNVVYGMFRQQTATVASSDASVDAFGGNVRHFIPHGGGDLTYDNAGGGGTTSYMDAYGNPTQIIRKSFNILGANYEKLYVWGDPANDLTAAPGYGGMPATSESPFPIGSASTLTDMPFDSKAIVAAMPLPIIRVDSFVSSGINNNELAMTNIAADLLASGFITAISNVAPNTIYLHNDGNLYFSTNRDANGYLTIDTRAGLFPDGTNYAKILHGYGLMFAQTIYAYQYPTNQIIVSILGAPVAPGTALSQPAMAPNNIPADISKMYDFGVDQVRIADMGAPAEGYYSLFTRRVADNILQPQVLAFSFLKVPYSQVTGSAGKNRLVPMGLEMLYDFPGMIPPFAWQSVNCVGNDQNGNWPGTAPSGGTNAVFMMDNFRANLTLGANNLGSGHYGIPLTFMDNADMIKGDAQFMAAASAMILSPIEFSINSANQVGTTFPNVLTALTNATFLKVRYDSLVNRPSKVFDFGATNVSCYARKLNNNGFAVGLFNEIGAAQSLTVNFAAIGADPAVTYSVTSAWDTNRNFGNYTGSFTYTNVPADGAELLLLAAVSTTAPASQFMGYSTNATRTANAVPVDSNTNGAFGPPNFLDSPVTIDPVTGNIVTPGTVTSSGGGGGGASTFGSTIFSDWTIGSSTTALAGYPSTPAQAAGGTLINPNTDLGSILYNNPAVASGTNYLEDNQQGVWTGYSGFVEFVFAITNTTSCNYRVGLFHQNDNASNFATNNAPIGDGFDMVWIDSGLVNFALETCNGSGITTNISTIAISTALNTLTVVRLTCNVSNVVMSVNGVPAATNSTSVMTNAAGKIFTMKTLDSTVKGFKMYHASSVWNY